MEALVTNIAIFKVIKVVRKRELALPVIHEIC